MYIPSSYISSELVQNIPANEYQSGLPLYSQISSMMS